MVEGRKLEDMEESGAKRRESGGVS